MKKLSKRIIAAIVTAVMVFTAIPLSVFANETDATVTQGNNDVSVTATNSLGAMLTDTLETAGMEPDGDYTITDLTFEGNTATVSYLNIDSCELVVAVYDENSMQMLTSEVTSVEADSVSATVTFTEALPEFFVAKAFLLDNDYAPLCKEYTSRRNTTEFVEFMALETTDFEEDKVINLDDSENNNFLVLGDDAQKIKGNEETNVLVSSDTETNTYVFENIDSNISSLKKGDIFHLDNGDMANLVVIKVASITIDGTTATMVAEESSLEEVFEVVKLDSDELKTGVEVDSAESGTVSEDCEVTFDAVEGGNEDDPWTNTKTFSLKKEFKNEKGDRVTITGTAVFTLSAHYKIYINKEIAEISFILNPSAVVTVTVDGEISERRYNIGHFYFKAYGVTVGIEPEFVFSASTNITLTGTWKTQIGFGFNTSDGFVNKSTTPTFRPTVNITGQFYIGFNLSPYLTFLHEAIVDVKFVAEIGVTVKGSYSNDSGHKCDNCIDGDLLWSAKLDIDIAILKGLTDTSDNKQYKKTLWNKKPTKFADFYYSFDKNKFGWGECPDNPYPGSGGGSGSGGTGSGSGDFEIEVVPGIEIIDSGMCGDTLEWMLTSDGQLLIGNGGDMYDYKSNNRPWEVYEDDITAVKMGTVDSIGDYAFYSLDNISTIDLSDSITRIGSHAFDSCENLYKATMPNNVYNIGNYAFYNCNNLVCYGNLYNIANVGDYAFYSCGYSGEITLSEESANINIGNYAFYNCDSVLSLNSIDTGLYPDKKIINIGDYAFYSCAYLDGFTFEFVDTVNIGAHAFDSCSNMWGCFIYDGNVNIGDYAFHNCDSLDSLGFFSASLNIGNYAFYSCENLSYIEFDSNERFPSKVATIGDYAFYNCSAIESFIIPNNVVAINKSAFEGCSNLTDITIPLSVTSIGDSAFNGCDSLSEVYWGGTEALWNEFDIGENNEPLYDAFIEFVEPDDSGYFSLNVGYDEFDDYYYYYDEFYWEYIFDEYGLRNTLIITGDAVLNNSAEIFYDELPWSEYESEINSVIIGNNITDIDCNVFSSLVSLKYLLLGKNAYIHEATLPIYTLKRDLQLILVNPNNQNLSSDYNGVLYNKDKTTLYQYPFKNTNSSISIPISVTKIAYQAFYRTNIQEIYYAGSQEQWKNILIESGNDKLTSATIHYNSTGPVSDSVSGFTVDSTESEIITADPPYCFEINGVAGNAYTLLNVTGYGDSFVLSGSNLLYIDRVVADGNGVITSSYIPKTFDENSTTLLIGDFGNGTEISRLAKVNELGIVSVTAKTDYIRYGDVVPVEVVTTGTPAKIRFVDTDGNTVTINSSVNNGDGTCTWNASITMLKESETYSVYAKYANGWDVNCKEITLTAQPFDDSYYSTEFEVISDGVIYNGMNTLTVKTGMDVSKVQLYKNGNTWTYTDDTATVAEENGVKVWTIKMNFSQLGDQTYYVRTRSRKTAFEVVDTLNLTVYSK